MKKIIVTILSITIAFCICISMGMLSVSANEVTVQNEKNYIVESIELVPTLEDWDSATKYPMEKVSETSEGATGTISFLANENVLYFKEDINDNTKKSNADGIYIKISNQQNTKTWETRGNYEKWLANVKDDFGTPVLFEQNIIETGYSTIIGIDLGDDLAEGRNISIIIKHRDRQDESGWADQDYEHTIQFSNILYFKTIVLDLPKLPTESDWENAKEYEMINYGTDMAGSTGCFKILTSQNNFYFRIKLEDETVNMQNDRIYILFESDDGLIKYEARGNYKNWLASIGTPVGVTTPSLNTNTTTASEAENWQPGFIVFELGYTISDYVIPNGVMHFCVKCSDSKDASQSWEDNFYPHTIGIDMKVTFGELADTTIRPQTPSNNFTAEISNISYNKLTIGWSEFESAVSYSIYEYKVNEQENVEPYEYLATEGPIPAGENSYSEELLGFLQSTSYAYQVVAIDADGNIIGYSSLVLADTISRVEAESLQAINDVIQKISSISTAKIDSDNYETIKSSVNEAKTAYNQLTTEQKQQVTNYSSLTSAETALSTYENSNKNNNEGKSGCKSSFISASCLGVISLIGISINLLKKKRK